MRMNTALFAMSAAMFSAVTATTAVALWIVKRGSRERD